MYNLVTHYILSLTSTPSFLKQALGVWYESPDRSDVDGWVDAVLQQVFPDLSLEIMVEESEIELFPPVDGVQKVKLEFVSEDTEATEQLIVALAHAKNKEKEFCNSVVDMDLHCWEPLRTESQRWVNGETVKHTISLAGFCEPWVAFPKIHLCVDKITDEVFFLNNSLMRITPVEAYTSLAECCALDGCQYLFKNPEVPVELLLSLFNNKDANTIFELKNWLKTEYDTELLLQLLNRIGYNIDEENIPPKDWLVEILITHAVEEMKEKGEAF